jgi:hypothetical protein
VLREGVIAAAAVAEAAERQAIEQLSPRIELGDVFVDLARI